MELFTRVHHSQPVHHCHSGVDVLNFGLADIKRGRRAPRDNGDWLVQLTVEDLSIPARSSGTSAATHLVSPCDQLFSCCLGCPRFRIESPKIDGGDHQPYFGQRKKSAQQATSQAPSQPQASPAANGPICGQWHAGDGPSAAATA